MAAVQSNLARPPTLFPAYILTPDIVYEITKGPLWINVEVMIPFHSLLHRILCYESYMYPMKELTW